jgi:hypothetical protein
VFHHLEELHIPGDKEVGWDEKERVVSQANLVITTLSQLDKAANAVEVGVDNSPQLMKAERVDLWSRHVAVCVLDDLVGCIRA